jgi:hypothetical protein
LISARGVLTVAHCLVDATSAQIILGAHEFTHIEPTQQRFTVSSSNFRIHPNYNAATFDSDIAIILLPGQGAILNQFVQPVSLPNIGVSDLFAGELATVSGWGEFAAGSEQGSSLLRSAQNNIITNAVCRTSLMASLIQDSTICITTAGNRGPCGSERIKLFVRFITKFLISEDAGGPWTIRGANGQPTLVGIMKFAGACGNGAAVAGVRVSFD